MGPREPLALTRAKQERDELALEIAREMALGEWVPQSTVGLFRAADRRAWVLEAAAGPPLGSRAAGAVAAPDPA
jgi:hypothetical protein